MKRQGWWKSRKWGKGLCAVLLAAALCLPALPLRAEAAARKTVFIGDSRTVGCYIAGAGACAASSVSATDRNGDFWSAKSGQGVDWAASYGVPAADSHVGSGTDAVFLFGVNDTYSLSGLQKTVNLVNKKAAAWKERGARTFFVSILPIRSSENGFTNAKIDAWNSYLQENLSEELPLPVHNLSDDLPVHQNRDTVHRRRRGRGHRLKEKGLKETLIRPFQTCPGADAPGSRLLPQRTRQGGNHDRKTD